MSNLLFCYIAELNFTVSYFSFTMFACTKRVKPIDVAKECILRGGKDPDGTTVQFISNVIGRNLLSYLVLQVSYNLYGGNN